MVKGSRVITGDLIIINCSSTADAAPNVKKQVKSSYTKKFHNCLKASRTGKNTFKEIDFGE